MVLIFIFMIFLNLKKIDYVDVKLILRKQRIT